MTNSLHNTLMALLAFAFVIVCATNAKSDEIDTVLPGNPIVAAHTFETKKCIRCHLVDNQHKGYGPDLARISLSNNKFDLVGRMWNSAPDMIAKMEQLRIEFPSLEPSEFSNLLAYLGVYQNYIAQYTLSANTDKGLKLFKKNNCVTCHTVDQSSHTLRKSLNRFRDSSSPLAVLRGMWLHSYYMKKTGVSKRIDWPQLSGEEMNDLVAFILSDDNGNDPQKRFLRPGSPRSGKKLISAYGCDKCHTVNGNGKGNAPDLGNIHSDRKMDVNSILEVFWNHSPTMWSTLRRKGVQASHISTNDLADIIAYLLFVNFDRSSVNKKNGKQLFESKSCVVCHEPNMTFKDSNDFLARMWNNLPEMLEESNQEGIEWPTLADGDLPLLIEYLNSVKEN